MGPGSRQTTLTLPTRSLAAGAFLYPQFAMRPQADELERTVIHLPIDQHKIGLNVAIPVILPLPSESVIPKAFRKWLIVGQHPHDSSEVPG